LRLKKYLRLQLRLLHCNPHFRTEDTYDNTTGDSFRRNELCELGNGSNESRGSGSASGTSSADFDSYPCAAHGCTCTSSAHHFNAACNYNWPADINHDQGRWGKYAERASVDQHSLAITAARNFRKSSAGQSISTDGAMPGHRDNGNPKRIRRKYDSRFDESKFNESEFNQSRIPGDGQHQRGQHTGSRNGTDESLHDRVRHPMPACACAVEYCAAFHVKNMRSK
jgi:hypothetical protein